jgi:predicted Zn-dependent protease
VKAATNKEQHVKGSLLALAVLTGTTLTGCTTFKGADDALMNLVGPSTQSRFTGQYIANEDVRSYYRLDPQRQSLQRLSYDGHTIPADEARQENIADIPMLQTYLQSIVVKLSKGWPGELPTLKVQITDSYSFGPSADPYGNVLVPLGMLENVESEDEIAAMLGHEMSHVLLHHHDRTAAFQQQKKMMTSLASMVIFGKTVADTDVDRSSGQTKFISKDPLGTQQTIGKTVLYTAMFNAFSDNVWSTAWGRTQEDQADLLGTDLMIRAGYAPRAASNSLQRLDDFQGKQKPLLTSFLNERKDAIQQSAKQMDINGMTKEVDVFLKQGVETSLKATAEYFNRSHMSALDRDEELRQYVQREYRQKRRARVDASSWQKMRAAAPVVAALQGYKDAHSASAALAQNQPAEAEIFIKRALSSPVKDQPGIRRSAFSVHLARGQRKEALNDLEAIRDWSLAGQPVYDLKIAYHLKNNDPKAALSLISLAETNLGSEELFITEKLVAHQQLKDDTQVKEIFSKCQQYASRKDSCKKLAPTARA